MNNQKRAEIKSLIEQTSKIKDHIEMLAEQEQEAFDNMPEKLQETEKGETAAAAAESLQYALDTIYAVIEYLSEAVEGA